MIFINGEDGPFSNDMPGGYGRNAADKLMQALEAATNAGEPSALESLEKICVQYTPADKPTFFDAFAFAQQQILHLSAGENGLTLETLAKLYLGNRKLAEQILQALDLNEDGEIDAVEYCAFILFSDDAVSLIGETFSAFADSQESVLLDAEKQQHLQEIACWLKAEHPSKASGEISPICSTMADLAIETFPTMTRITLESIMRQCRLKERYQEFLALS
jgi:hypothetical protein